MQIKTSIRTTRMQDIVTALGATSRLIVYTGSPPSNTAMPTGTPLVTFTLANPAGTVTDGVLTFSAITPATASATGTPGYTRFIDGTTDDGTHTVLQCTAGVGSGEFNFDSTIGIFGTETITGIIIADGSA